MNLFCLFLLVTNKIDDLIELNLFHFDDECSSFSQCGALLYWFYHAIYILIYTIHTDLVFVALVGGDIDSSPYQHESVRKNRWSCHIVWS